MKSYKIIKCCIIFLITISVLSCNIYAREIIQSSKDWLDTGEDNRGESGLTFADSYEELEDLAGTIFGIGVFVVIAVGFVLGAKFMIGTVPNQVEVKKTLGIYLLGSVLILGALGIWRLLINVFENVM